MGESPEWVSKCLDCNYRKVSVGRPYNLDEKYNLVATLKLKCKACPSVIYMNEIDFKNYKKNKK